MRYLLAAINAKYIHSNLAVYSLKAYASGCGGRIELAEYTINQRMDEILKDLYEKKPDLIAFSCYIWNISLIERLIPELAKVLPETVIWAGGPEVSFDPLVFLKRHKEVAGVMVFEGEETFAELIRYYEGGGANGLAGIAGIIFRRADELVSNPARPPLDLSLLPFPYGELGNLENRIIYYESSRGCPFSCSYCLSSVDKTLRFRNLDLVREELLFFLRHRVKQVKFVDRTFNCRREHAMEIWRFIAAHDNGVTNFHFEAAADLLREEELLLLQSLRPGLVQLEIGVQSANQKTLLAIGRQTDLELLARNVKRLQAGRHIHLHLDLIAGLPDEDISSFKKSFNWVYALKPDQLQLGFLKVLKGAPIMQRQQEFSIRYQDTPPYEVLSTAAIDYGGILMLKEVEEMVEVYYNSGQFKTTIKYLERAFVSPFEMFFQLARFYKEAGFDLKKPSRLHRYELLLEFAGAFDSSHRSCYQELLTYDLYLREKLKSRPAFAPKLLPYRKRLREFDRRRKVQNLAGMTHLEVFQYDIPAFLLAGEGDLKRRETALLFDYQSRDEFSKEAQVYPVRLPKEERV